MDTYVTLMIKIKERDAVKKLSEEIDALITNANKSGSVAICETKNYINEVK